MTKTPIDFEIITPNGLQMKTIMLPWVVTMRSIVTREIGKIEAVDGNQVIHVFQNEECLMRKFGIPRSKKT